VSFDLGHGNALLRYTEETEEDGDSLTIHYWQFANPVPPNHFRIAIFSYSVLTERNDDEDVTADIAMLDEELRRCEFASELGE